jgi:hypothetical protein
MLHRLLTSAIHVVAPNLLLGKCGKVTYAAVIAQMAGPKTLKPPRLSKFLNKKGHLRVLEAKAVASWAEIFAPAHEQIEWQASTGGCGLQP